MFHNDAYLPLDGEKLIKISFLFFLKIIDKFQMRVTPFTRKNRSVGE